MAMIIFIVGTPSLFALPREDVKGNTSAVPVCKKTFIFKLLGSFGSAGHATTAPPLPKK